MKRLRLISLVGALLLMASLASCGGEGATTTAAASITSEGATTTTGAVTSTSEGVSTTASAEPFRVAVLVDGTIDDKSWSNAIADGGARASSANPNIQIEYVELLGDPEALMAQGSAFASEGYDFILIGIGYMYEQALAIAEQFPDVQVCQFMHVPTVDEAAAPDNLCWIDITEQTAYFKTGALAALVSQTGHIGALGGQLFPTLTRGLEAFNLGARCVNPDIQFSQQYVNTWTDTAISKAATQAMIADGVDVLLGSIDLAVMGMISAAEEAPSQVWIVTSYYDQRSLGPDVILSSAIIGMEYMVADIIQRAYAGDIGPGEWIQYTAANDPELQALVYDDVRAMLSAEDLATFEDIVARVDSGEITIPATILDEPGAEYEVGTEGSGATIPLDAIGCGG